MTTTVWYATFSSSTGLALPRLPVALLDTHRAVHAFCQRLATLELEEAAFQRSAPHSALGLESPSRGRAAVPIASQAYSQNSALRFAIRLCVKLAKQGEQLEETKMNDNLVGAYAAILVSCISRGNEVREARSSGRRCAMQRGTTRSHAHATAPPSYGAAAPGAHGGASRRNVRDGA